jgi:diguanylate cyclase (GGDEF)-like protein/PAS domain S-box-containing protein
MFRGWNAAVSAGSGGKWMRDASAYRQSPVALCWMDMQSRIVAVNEQFERLMARSASDLRGRPIEDLIPLAAEGIRRATSPQQSAEPLEFRLPDRLETFQLAAATVHNADRAPAGLSLAIIDVSVRKHLEERLSTVDERVSFALESAGQWIWELDIASGRVWRSPGWKAILGFGDEEIPHEYEAWAIVHPDDRDAARHAMQRVLEGEENIFEAIYRVIHQDGGWRWILSRGKVVGSREPGGSLRLLATSVDITGQKEVERALEAAIAEKQKLEKDLRDANSNLQRLTETDFLTSLSNRRKFDRTLEDALRQAGRTGSSVGLLMIDVDFFKPYNDLYGHVAGDTCLRGVADALRQSADRDVALISRYGGEEFAFIVTNTSLLQIAALAERVAVVIDDKNIPHEGSLFGVVTVSIGLAILEGHSAASETAQQFVRRADNALYRAKIAGRNQIRS